LSQKVVDDVPCESFEFQTESEAVIDCIADIGQACSCPSGYQDQNDIVNSYIEPLDVLLSQTLDPLIILGLSTEVTVGEVCCPVGTTLRDDGDLVNTLLYAVLYQLLAISEDLNPAVSAQLRNISRRFYEPLICEANVRLFSAEPVPSPEDPQYNVLDRFQGPFSVTLPAGVDAGGNGWISTTPDGKEGI
jgi:hypothetical protein